jgi:Kef-type K+ transport system membrane component KefB
VIGILPIGTAVNLAISSVINLQHFADKLFQAPGILILQLIIIMVVARIMGYLFQVMGQPLVIGEIVAGLILGPSVLGMISPQVFEFIFPVESIDILQQLSQLGLIFFMFIIGMELDTQSLRKSANKAILISIAGIIIPFISGVLLAFYLNKDYLPKHIEFTSFALFMGTTMCITAFPILARIVQERKLTRTTVGTMAITLPPSAMLLPGICRCNRRLAGGMSYLWLISAFGDYIYYVLRG